MRPRRGGARPGVPPVLRAAAALVALCSVAVLGAAGTAAVAAPAATRPSPGAASRPISRFVEVPESPQGAARIRLDTDLYLPATRPAPAVLLAHGFGQDKRDLAADAKRLQGKGYVVLAYSARGFGRSGGRIGLDSLDGEVPDARALIGLLARRPEVIERGGDPLVGVVGASYGGALALMLGATDPRIDTVVAGITWNDLAQALAPSSSGRAGGGPPERVFKSGWAARLFGTGAAGDPDPCGRFTPQICGLYRRLVTGAPPSEEDLALLRRSSPSSVLDWMTAPTLLVQGLQDSLFGLDQADANRRQIRAARAPARVRWFDGGHDGGGVAGTEQAVDGWLDARLKRHWWPWERFEYDVPASATSFAEHRTARRYPGLEGDGGSTAVRLDGREQTVVNPPGGQPASVTSLPGVPADSDVGRAASGLLARQNPPAQAARFVSARFRAPVVLTGTTRLRVRVESVGAAAEEDVVLFGQLAAVTGSGRRVLPGGVAPVRVRLPAEGAVLDVAMPATVWRFAPGDRLELTLRTTDSQYLGSAAPASFRVSMAGPISLPEVAPRAARDDAGLPSRRVLERVGMLLAVAVLLLLGAAIAGRLRRRSDLLAEGRSAARAAADTSAAPPLALRGVTKRFPSGFVAVDDVSFSVGRGQVVGLLGENGAGKTTTLRMVMGLIRPGAGVIEAFGVRVEPGSPVLRRVGCFVEGPGFLPHLSGRRNLELFWAATGRRRSEARFDEVLAVADLGSAIRRRVRGYSQGMRQRLAIAQAMLGMPDLLVLDEPTNGLDPPQITALRGVLRRYAEGGRTVVVSSHLLGEVELTCSHVVIMSHGRVVAAGPVGEVAGDAGEVVFGVDDPVAAVAALEAAGVGSAQPAGSDAVRVEPGAVPVGAMIAALVHAGVTVTGLRSGRHLEEAFLDLIDASEPAG